MSNNDFHRQIDEAKAYQAERVAQAQQDIEDAQRTLRDAEERLAHWQRLSPYEIIGVMADDRRRQAAADTETERKARLQADHEAAVREALASNKGILPAGAAGPKSIAFGATGALLGAILASMVGAHYLHLGEVGSAVASIVGGVAGLVGGWLVFARNFVTDESLEQSVFSKFGARDVVRRTYFKDMRG